MARPAAGASEDVRAGESTGEVDSPRSSPDDGSSVDAATADGANSEQTRSAGDGTALRRIARTLDRRMLRYGSPLVAALVSIAFSLSFGFNYGIGNHNGYLNAAYRMFDPSAFSRDWYTTEVTHYHQAFGYLGWLLYEIDSSGWSFAVANVVATAAAAWLVYWIAATVVRRHEALVCHLFVVAVWFVTQTKGAGFSYLVSWILQPATLGSVGALAAMLLFVRRRWLGSGIALGLGGLFHANFLVLLGPVFFAAHLLLGKRRLLPRLLRQLSPPLIALALLLPVIWTTAMSPDGDEAREILFRIRSAHHYVPRRYMSEFLPFAGWQMLGLAMGGHLLRNGRSNISRLGALVAPMVALVWVGTALTTVTYIPTVAALFVWRLVPIVDMVFQVLVAAGMARIVTRPGAWRRITALQLIAAPAGLVLVMMNYAFRDGGGRFITLMVNAMLALAAVKLLSLAARSPRLVRYRPRIRHHVGRTAVWLLILFAGHQWYVVAKGPLRPKQIVRRSSLLWPPKEEDRFFQWIAENTPKDALFLSPPTMPRFRLQTKRAIVVDWKATPIVPGEVLEWYRRIKDVAGSDVKSQNELRRLYARMNRARLEKLHERYGFDYVMLPTSRVPRGLKAYPVVHKGKSAILLAVPDDGLPSKPNIPR